MGQLLQHIYRYLKLFGFKLNCMKKEQIAR
jgi:hypothetical protein